MRIVRRHSMFLAWVIIFGFMCIVAMPPDRAGAEEKKRTTLKGAGLGALAGQIIGKDTESTLIGGVVGAGIGYLIGDKKDEETVKQLNTQVEPQQYRHDQVATLGDTIWQIETMSPKERVPAYVSKVISFRPDGRLITLTTEASGAVTMSEETYRVVDNTLIINKPGYVVNAKFAVENDTLVLTAQEFGASLRRLHPET